MDRSTQNVLSADGVAISVDVYGTQTHTTAIIICPGFFQSKDTATFQRMSATLARTSDVIAMDFRGHGRSGGLFTFSALEGMDLEAVLRWVQPRYERIGMLGFSLGGATTINAVSRHPDRVVSVIAVSAPATFEEIEFQWWTPEAMRTGIRGLEPGAGCRPGNLFLKKERPIEHVRNLSPIPILFIHGTRDVIVGVQHSHRLYAAANEPKRLEIIEGGSHAEALFRDDPQRFSDLVNTWYQHTLPMPA